MLKCNVGAVEYQRWVEKVERLSGAIDRFLQKRAFKTYIVYTVCIYFEFIFTAIRSHSPAKPVLIFVSSRRQTRLTALDLIAYLATEDNPKQWLHQDEREVR